MFYFLFVTNDTTYELQIIYFFAITSICLEFASGALHAQSHDIDISGIHLGMTVAQVKERILAIPGYRFEQGPNSSADDGHDYISRVGGMADYESVTVYFLPNSGLSYRVSRSFHADPGVLLDNFKDTVASKYGKFSLNREPKNPTSINYLWVWDRSGTQLGALSSAVSSKCGFVNFSNPLYVPPQCGVMLEVSGGSVNNIITNYDITATDIGARLDDMARGEAIRAEIAKRQREQAAKVPAAKL